MRYSRLIREQSHGRVHTRRNLPPQIYTHLLSLHPIADQTKGSKTHLNVHQMLKHIVFSQKNAARKKKCAMIAETEREKWTSLQTSLPMGKELKAVAFLAPERIIFPTDNGRRI